MAELTEFLKGLIIAPAAWIGSVEYRLRGKVGSKTCHALHEGLQQEMTDFKKHVDTRIKDLKDFQRSQTDLIIGEIKKTNGE